MSKGRDNCCATLEMTMMATFTVTRWLGQFEAPPARSAGLRGQCDAVLVTLR